MVISCSAYGCKNKWSRQTPVHFHKFPFRSEKLCEKWISALKRKNFIPTRASLVCSDHFKEDDYVRKPGMAKKRLKKNAIPSIFNFPVLEEFPWKCIEHLTSKSSSKLFPKKLKKKRNVKSLQKNKISSDDSNFIEMIIDERDENNYSDLKSTIKLDYIESIDKEDYTDEELANADEEDKCYVLGSLWGERLKILPLDVRVSVRRLIDKIFEEARIGTLSEKFILSEK